MSERERAIAEVLRQFDEAGFDEGSFAADLDRRIAYRTESPVPSSLPARRAYLAEEMAPTLERLGFAVRTVEGEAGGLFLIACRRESEDLPTVLLYGHGDTVPGMEGAWADGRDPWRLTRVGDRLYGRGSADNKGQHSVNFAALDAVLRVRGRLGFNATLLLEMGEELGSPGLRALCRAERAALAADVLIASDGPRLSPERPTVFLGSRGAVRLRFTAHLRDGAHHSGNWGGLIGNAATVLANALAHCVDGRGVLRVPGLRASPPETEVVAALAEVAVSGGPGDPLPDPDWGEPGLTSAERVFAANTLEVLALGAGNPAQPAAAIPGRAEAVVQLRFVVGLDWREVGPILQRHLDEGGFESVRVTAIDGGNATRTLASDKWVRWALASLARSTGKNPALLPNFGGTLPNDVFVEELALPTLWIPHSYPGCSQHAPDEHNLLSVLREGAALMTGLFWDLDEGAPQEVVGGEDVGGEDAA